MKTISITSNNLSTIFEQIQNQLGGNLEIKSKEYRLEINNETAKGFVSGISVEPAISYIEYDVVFKEDVTLTYRHDNPSSIHFGYCSKGNLTQSFGKNGQKNKLAQFQTGIFSNSSKKRTFLDFKKDEDVKVSMITVDTLSVSDKELKNHLQETFLLHQENNEFSYIGSFNLKIVEKIDHLSTISQQGLIRNLLINSTVYLILALEIEQHKYDSINAESNCYSLSQSDMEAIRDISEFIRNYPEIQYSLKYLSRKSGLSPIKLQEGFKIMHNRTVTDFIRNVRVEAAENLIRTSELNISEIVYTIGLTSRSYFSKIFKAKYNCSPKHYQNQQNRLAITA
ncbi:helix-turn-helix domain-containing protein [Mariniflexile gromovii]|uniref:Helix-turn-helix transcriptional regulator n=1 Tax=Mariniflexile gromovii TaxID=362523 RepID=A0ABS4BSY4_9FLAO|nr:AraC family transcriptional regulator [Mariniflexile gromovii]MBP0903681.1 helix-turn-helix transcriptional regulator [Mariniflexile gromovii]